MIGLQGHYFLFKSIFVKKTEVRKLGFHVVSSDHKIHEAVFFACLVIGSSAIASTKLSTSVIQFFMR